ncbi:hypothetical protein TRAPUB_905 [Trametes pubescens]|uniref:Uncharacterized protein n=1 Tax=Trametes pubescens TaxID=154538 RepID=A0A1M2VKX3_TRAPU|nr:hypothetical protein TRAPUB_905 [Trametes pubescens]
MWDTIKQPVLEVQPELPEDMITAYELRSRADAYYADLSDASLADLRRGVALYKAQSRH